jgi:hypothetical protein
MAARKKKTVTKAARPTVSETDLECICYGHIGRTAAARVLALAAMLRPGQPLGQGEARNDMQMAAFEVEEGLRDLKILVTTGKLNNFEVDWENQTLTYTGGENGQTD